MKYEGTNSEQRWAFSKARASWMLDISRPTLDKLIQEGRLQTIPIQRKKLIPAWALERFLRGKDGNGEA